jgi:hypothetical protein
MKYRSRNQSLSEKPKIKSWFFDAARGRREVCYTNIPIFIGFTVAMYTGLLE